MGHTILYVPGLGDKKRWLLSLQRLALSLWRRHDVRVEILPMYWSEDIPLKPRFYRLLNRIDQLHDEGLRVSLVGTSAGASAVVSAYALRRTKVAGVVTICGKLQGDIPDLVKQLNPCFDESLQLLRRSLRNLPKQCRRRIMTISAARDVIVPASDASLDGALNIQLPLAGHNTSCAASLLFRSQKITQFLSYQAENSSISES